MLFSMISEQISERLYVMDMRDNYTIGMYETLKISAIDWCLCPVDSWVLTQIYLFTVSQTTSHRYLIKNIPLQFPSPLVILIPSERSLKRLFQHYKVSLYADYLYL